MRCLSERGGPGKLRSYWEQQVHVSVGQTGNPPVLEVRPEILTGKPRVLHINLLLPFDFHQVDHPDPSANQSQGKVPSSSPRKARERLQNDKLGTSDSVDEDDSSGLSLTEFETLQLCTPTGDTERRREGKAEVTNETTTEDVATPWVMTLQTILCYLTLKLKTNLFLGQETEKKHCQSILTRQPPNVLL